EFSPDGKLVKISDPTGIKLWDIKTGHLLRELQTDIDFFFIDNGILVGGESEGSKIVSWNPNDLSTTVIGNTPRDSVFRTISSDRTTGVACAGDEDDLTKIWNLRTGVIIRSIKTRCDDVFLSAGGKLLLAADQDPDPQSPDRKKTITLWEVTSGRQLMLRKDVQSYAYSLEIDRLAVINESDKNIVILNPRTGAEVRSFKNDKAFSEVYLSWDGKVLAAANERMVRVWDAGSGVIRRDFENGATSLAINADGSLLGIRSGSVVGGAKEFAIYDTRTGEKLRGFEAMAEGPSSLDFSTDGRMLASGTSGTTVKLWNFTSGEVLRTLNHGENGVSSILFSDDMKTLVSGSNFVKLWSLGGTRVFRLKGFTDVISVLALTHDGHTLASKGADANSIELYDADQANKIATLTGHTNLEPRWLFLQTI